MRALAPDLWIADRPLRFFGIGIGARMTVIRLPGSRLLLHSPVAYSRRLAEQVEKLGTPAILVAPNRFHHLFIRGWQTAYPGAHTYAAPGVTAKRRDIGVNGTLGGPPPADWPDLVDQTLVEGFPLANEVVLFHRPTSTLVTSDLVFNVGAHSPTLTRLAFRLTGAYGRPSSTLLERFFVRDRAAFRRSLQRILEWPIVRLVMAHGAVVESGGHAALERAYSWILGGSAGRAN